MMAAGIRSDGLDVPVVNAVESIAKLKGSNLCASGAMFAIVIITTANPVASRHE